MSWCLKQSVILSHGTKLAVNLVGIWEDRSNALIAARDHAACKNRLCFEELVYEDLKAEDMWLVDTKLNETNRILIPHDRNSEDQLVKLSRLLNTGKYYPFCSVCNKEIACITPALKTHPYPYDNMEILVFHIYCHGEDRVFYPDNLKHVLLQLKEFEVFGYRFNLIDWAEGNKNDK